jgi:hypothetical protein
MNAFATMTADNTTNTINAANETKESNMITVEINGKSVTGTPETIQMLINTTNTTKEVKQRTTFAKSFFGGVKKYADKTLDYTAVKADWVENEGVTYGMEKSAKGMAYTAMKLATYAAALQTRVEARKSDEVIDEQAEFEQFKAWKAAQKA